ncbi:MAG TPA: SbcC/MukB-like Walker B domain-containing protein, partial [Aggregatilineales bacterium]|nr:SbcC/MukB-like Walker B domain-containing protein [Aggregatilineales bacterium]
RDAIIELEARETQREVDQEQISEAGEARAALISENKSLRVTMDEIRNRLDILEASTEPICPLCHQPLNEQQKADLIEQTHNEGKQYGDAYRANAARIEAIDDNIEDLKAHIKGASQYLKELPGLRARLGGFEQQMNDAHGAASRVQSHEIKLNQLQNTLAEEHYGEAIREQLDAAHTRRATIGYDEEHHDAVRDSLETYLSYQDKASELEVARNNISDAEQSLDVQRKSLDRIQSSIQEYKAQVEAQTVEIERLEGKVVEMNLRKDELNHQRSLQRNADEKVMAVEQSLRSIANMRVRRAEMIERRSQLSVDENIFDQLKNAFGRNGVPAMIIDAAIPELEEAANRLLSKMTGNRMHLRFETQREKKTGGMAETLDIWIQDELGQRDYSLFSGGEAFRVDFAIRVALSQLLARRAGAQLRTLFIDEGFGTQDDAGRERLIEAINTIQDDFDLVLVITHIEELKDAFPAHIEVTKTPNGSLAVVR